MTKYILACSLLLAGTTGPRAEESVPESPSMEHLSYFPTQMGRRSLYVKFYGSRKHKKRKLVEKAFWEEVVATKVIHGFRVIVIRSSTGKMTKEGGKWVYGEPDTIERETLYTISSKGVSLLAVYSAAGGTDDDYKKIRKESLEEYEEDDREYLVGEMQNWILPFPVKPGLRRKWPVSDKSYYKILRGGNKWFVNKKFRKKAFGVAGFIGGEWGVTRWFVPGKGLVLSETYNNDEGADAKRYPFKLTALAVYAGQ